MVVQRTALTSSCPRTWADMVAMERAREEKARGVMVRQVSCLAEWNLCGALAYDADRHGRSTSRLPFRLAYPNLVISDTHIHLWLVRCEQVLGRRVQAIFAPEQHRVGGPHWHGLLAAGPIQRNDVVTFEEEWMAYHGYARLERPRSCAPPVSQRSEMVGEGVLTSPLSAEEFCAKYLWKPEGTLVLHGFSDAAVRSFRAVLEDLIWVDESL